MGAHPARAHLEQAQPRRCRQQVPEQSADHRQRTLPGGQVGQGLLRADGRQQGLLGRRSQDRRARLPLLYEPRHDGRGAAAGQHPVLRRLPGTVPALHEQGRLHRPESDVRLLGEHRHQLLCGHVRRQTLAESRQPGAQRLALPQRAQLGHRPQQDRRHRLSGRRHPGDRLPALQLLEGAFRLPLGPARRPGLHIRPGQGQSASGGRRLHRHQRRRLPRLPRQAHQPAPVGLQREERAHRHRQASGRLAQGHRHQGDLCDHGRRRSVGPPLQPGQRQVHARLRPVHLGLGRRLRPGLSVLDLHD